MQGINVQIKSYRALCYLMINTTQSWPKLCFRLLKSWALSMKPEQTWKCFVGGGKLWWSDWHSSQPTLSSTWKAFYCFHAGSEYQAISNSLTVIQLTWVSRFLHSKQVLCSAELHLWEALLSPVDQTNKAAEERPDQGEHNEVGQEYEHPWGISLGQLSRLLRIYM